jgi:type IV pilus assembly protein PilY1
VAIFGAGYDKASDPNETASYAVGSGAGRALVMLDLKTGQVLGIKQFDPAGGATNPATFPYDPVRPERSMHYALAADPSVFDLDFDGFADVVYIGDLGGNVWKWVIGAVGEDPINGSGSTSQPAWPFGRFFSAPVHVQSGTNYYKSFFHSPAATLKNGRLWLAFGSGERAKLEFPGFTATTGENNRFYAVIDLDPHEESAPPGGRQPLGESALLNTSGNESCPDVSAYRGYYFLGEDGEKFVTSPDIFFYYVFVASYVPTPATNPCEAGGQAYLYAFKVYCGEGLFDDGSGNPDRSMDIGDGLATDPRISCGADESQVIVNIHDRIERPKDPLPGLSGTAGQAFWRELTQ